MGEQQKDVPPGGWSGYERILWNCGQDYGMTLREADLFVGSPFGQAIARMLEYGDEGQREKAGD